MIFARRLKASAGENTIELSALPKPSFLYAVEALNETKGDLIAIYVKAKAGDAVSDVCGLVGRTPTINPFESINWNGKVPLSFPARVVAQFYHSDADDVLWLKVVFGEKL